MHHQAPETVPDARVHPKKGREEGRTHEPLPTSLNLEPTQICARGLGSVPQDLRCTIRALDLAPSDGSCVFGGQSLQCSVGTLVFSHPGVLESEARDSVQSNPLRRRRTCPSKTSGEMDLAGASRCWGLVVSRSVFRQCFTSKGSFQLSLHHTANCL